MQNTKIKSARILFAAVFLLFSLYSVFFTVKEADHECCGEDCPICFVIQIAQQAFKLLLLVISSFVAIKAGIFFLQKNCGLTGIKVSNNKSLIALKIRIND